MANQSHDNPEQEHSIKQRSLELFLQHSPDQRLTASKPFDVHLRETAAQPISTLTKAILWAVGIIVTLLFLAAILRIVQRHNSPVRSSPTSASVAIPEAMGKMDDISRP